MIRQRFLFQEVEGKTNIAKGLDHRAMVSGEGEKIQQIAGDRRLLVCAGSAPHFWSQSVFTSSSEDGTPSPHRKGGEK